MAIDKIIHLINHTVPVSVPIQDSYNTLAHHRECRCLVFQSIPCPRKYRPGLIHLKLVRVVTLACESDLHRFSSHVLLWVQLPVYAGNNTWIGATVSCRVGTFVGNVRKRETGGESRTIANWHGLVNRALGNRFIQGSWRYARGVLGL